ncbi:MAG TPA: hypothetical protein VM600_03800 [Actinomycetota bacterium]|nr:hypothetical protein [Actinomycetota bacterium]
MRTTRRAGVALICALTLLTGTMLGARADGDPPAVPKADCPDEPLRETGLQGRAPAEDYPARAAQGYQCNAEMVSRFNEVLMPGGSGGFRTYRYVDAAGNECAFYDSVLLFPLNATTQKQNLLGVFVLDMSNPAAPRKTANLQTPAMLSPHESLSLNRHRGLLAAVNGNPTTGPGVIDIYDVKTNCLQPRLISSTPFGIFGHEGEFSPDGNTFWVTSTAAALITAVDISDPLLPRVLFTTRQYRPHGLNISDDGNTLYLADTTSGRGGLTILDVSQVQARAAQPTATELSHLTWDTLSIPQTNIPITVGGHPYLVEIDEYARGLGAGNPAAPVGAGRIIDIADPRSPSVVSDLRLEVHQRENIAAIAEDPGANFQLQGYAGHYCQVPQREDPGVVACSMIGSGLRLFDIRDPHAPAEIAYFNRPMASPPPGLRGGAFAMSQPAFAPERGQIWYTDGNTGFYAVKIKDGVWPFE